MVTAFQIVLLVILIICGLGSTVDNNHKHYITTYGLTAVLFLLSVIVNILAR